MTRVLKKMVLSPDGKKIAVAYHHDVNRLGLPIPFDELDLVRIWDLAAGKEEHELKGHLRDILDLAYSPDGRFLVTADNKATEYNEKDERTG